MADVYAYSLAAADHVLHQESCRDPLPLLAAVMTVMEATEDSPLLLEADKTEVSDAIAFLAERLATVTRLVDKSAPAVNFAN